jgi:hypothetical protein
MSDCNQLEAKKVKFELELVKGEKDKINERMNILNVIIFKITLLFLLLCLSRVIIQITRLTIEVYFGFLLRMTTFLNLVKIRE